MPAILRQIDQWRGRDFDDLPAYARARVMGVDYLCLDETDGGQLYLTRHGWPMAHLLHPRQWFADRQYHRIGERLAGATGAVYRVPVGQGPQERQIVVKFSRFAQDVPLHITATFSHNVPRQVVDNAQFNSPFEEFALVSDLRRGRYGPTDLLIHTKRPLAIYCPAEEHDASLLGRLRTRLNAHARELAHDQQDHENRRAVELHERRLYVVIYSWVRGADAHDYHARGLLDDSTMRQLTRRVRGELDAKGFLVLDHKPRHIILRQRPDGTFLRDRTGELAYVLIDFELLQRNEAYLEYLRNARSLQATSAGARV